MDDILKEAAETIRRLGTAAEDCISCAHSSEGGCSTEGCHYRWKYADRTEKTAEHGPRSREQVCSQQIHCLSCPLSVMRTGRDCRELSLQEIREIMEEVRKNDDKR